MATSAKMRQKPSLLIIGIILVILGFLLMSQKMVTYVDNNPVQWRIDPLFLIIGTLVYLWGALAICYLVWKTGRNPAADERNLFLIRKILRKQFSNPELKQLGNEMAGIGLIFTTIGILGSPFLLLSVSSIIPVGRPQASYAPTLLIIILGLTAALSGFWIKYLSLVEEERELWKKHNHSAISSRRLSTGDLSALDSVSARRDLMEIRKSQQWTKSLMIIIVLVAVAALNPFISPVDGIHDSDLDGYADAIDPSPYDPRYWEGNQPIYVNLELGENTSDWLISITQVRGSHEVEANEIFIQLQTIAHDTYQPVYWPLIALSDNSSLYSIGLHYVDVAPLGVLNVGDQIAFNKSTYDMNTVIRLTDSTGIPDFGQYVFARSLL